MSAPPARSRKKLIEVALPLDAINAASARTSKHAASVLAVARAVIFVQMVDNPSACPKFFPTLGPQ